LLNQPCEKAAGEPDAVPGSGTELGTGHFS